MNIHVVYSRGSLLITNKYSQQLEIFVTGTVYVRAPGAGLLAAKIGNEWLTYGAITGVSPEEIRNTINKVEQGRFI